MKDLIILAGIVLLYVQSSNAQIVECDSVKFTSNNCATNLVKNYISKIDIMDNDKLKITSLRITEILKNRTFEEEVNGVFVVSNLSTRRRQFIVLKKQNQIKLLTFNDIRKLKIEIISFLRDIRSSDEELLNYMDSIQEYIQSKKITTVNDDNKDMNWVSCK